MTKEPQHSAKVKRQGMGIPARDYPDYSSPRTSVLVLMELKRLAVRGLPFTQVESQFLRQEVASRTAKVLDQQQQQQLMPLKRQKQELQQCW